MIKPIEKEIFKKYVTEMKDKSIICNELGISEENLNAWIHLFNIEIHRTRKKVRNKWRKMIPHLDKRISL